MSTTTLTQTPATSTGSDVVLRALISTQNAAVIIGKGGENIKEIRTRSEARITISDATPRSPERILIVSGPIDAVSKAFGLIVRRINGENLDEPSSPDSNSVTLRLLIPHSRVGAVIGKGGQRVREIQEQSGAKVSPSNNVLPNSTERVVDVIGVADAVHIAIYYIGVALLENNAPLRNHVSYRPRAPHTKSAATFAAAYRKSNAKLAQSGEANGSIEKELQAAGLDPQAVKEAIASELPRNIDPATAETENIFVPTKHIGALIGKRGARINEIRGLSNTVITVYDAGESGAKPDERLVSITGAAQGVRRAVSRILSLLEGEKAKEQRN